jgi:thiamine biosynthesis lipoprotein ApbE
LAESPYRFVHENVLGTTLDLRIAAQSPQAASRAEQMVLDEIERLRLILSAHDPISELNRWIAGQLLTSTVSEELYEVLRLSDRFRESTHGAFNPNVQVASSLWKRCESEQRMPKAEELKNAISEIGRASWELKQDSLVAHRLKDTPISLDAIAKGFIIDSSCNFAMKQPGINGVIVNIGGDVLSLGAIDEPIDIANPFSGAENSEFLSRFRLKNRAIATSGGYHRGYDIQGRHYSHIIDPQSALPVASLISVSVIANNAVTADALATAMSVLGVERSLQLCEAHLDVECMLVSKDGQVFSTKGWPSDMRSLEKLVVYGPSDAKNGQTWDEHSKLYVDLEINNSSQGGRYRRPYVAVWLEDQSGFPVRTLALWLQTTEPGPRWHRDLRQWFKNDTMRKLVDGQALIGSISSATKAPGKYKLVWDGKDDHGKFVEKGKYTLYVEAAREHGTYQIIKKELDLADKAFKEALDGNIEIKSVELDYRLGVE